MLSRRCEHLLPSIAAMAEIAGCAGETPNRTLEIDGMKSPRGTNRFTLEFPKLTTISTIHVWGGLADNLDALTAGAGRCPRRTDDGSAAE
jgi:hypothetical protein